MTPARLRTAFLTVATLEALSWAGLLVGMYLKYLAADPTEIGVKIFGPIHGALFVLYLLTVLVVRRPFAWSLRTLAVAMVCAVPPFFTVLFEILADRRGLLSAPAATPPTAG